MDITTTAPSSTAVTDIELAIGGMTCASCANRIERKLNKLDGVTATVNYATEKARISAPSGVDPATLVAQVEAVGYTAELPKPPARTADGDHTDEPDPSRSVRDRLIISVILSVPVIALAMVPALQFTYWQWISLALAGPVVVWAAWPFHNAAWANLRHGTATMDTLSPWVCSRPFCGRCGRCCSAPRAWYDPRRPRCGHRRHRHLPCRPGFGADPPDRRPAAAHPVGMIRTIAAARPSGYRRPSRWPGPGLPRRRW